MVEQSNQVPICLVMEPAREGRQATRYLHEGQHETSPPGPNSPLDLRSQPLRDFGLSAHRCQHRLDDLSSRRQDRLSGFLSQAADLLGRGCGHRPVSQVE